MGVVEGRTDSDCDRQRDRQGHAAGMARGAQQLAGVAAVHVLHGVVVLAAGLAAVEDLDHVGVVEVRGQPRLVEEHPHELLVRREVRQHPLEHHELLKARDPDRAGEVQLGHAADGQPPQQLVPADPRARSEQIGFLDLGAHPPDSSIPAREALSARRRSDQSSGGVGSSGRTSERVHPARSRSRESRTGPGGPSRPSSCRTSSRARDRRVVTGARRDPDGLGDFTAGQAVPVVQLQGDLQVGRQLDHRPQQDVVLLLAREHPRQRGLARRAIDPVAR